MHKTVKMQKHMHSSCLSKPSQSISPFSITSFKDAAACQISSLRARGASTSKKLRNKPIHYRTLQRHRSWWEIYICLLDYLQSLWIHAQKIYIGDIDTCGPGKRLLLQFISIIFLFEWLVLLWDQLLLPDPSSMRAAVADSYARHVGTACRRIGQPTIWRKKASIILPTPNETGWQWVSL